MRQAEWRAEDQFGGSLTEEQRALARERAGNIWDVQQKEEEPAAKAFKALENARVPEITNSLQRIGALGAGGATGIDYTKSTAQTTKDILAAVNKIASKAESQQNVMTF